MKSTNLKMGKSLKKNKLLAIILDSYNYKVIIILMMLDCFFNSFNLSLDYNFENSFTIFISTKMYVFTLILFIFYNTNKIKIWFDNNWCYTIRFKNKKNYILDILKNITISNLIIFFMYTIMGLAMVILKVGLDFEFKVINYYKIPVFIYNTFLLIKYFIIINFISCFGVVLSKLFSKFFSYFYYILIFILSYNFSISLNIISEFNIKYLIFNYYLGIQQYNDFFTEIVHFLITSSIYYIILEILIYITIKFKKIAFNRG